ncbi:DUF6585 family protein [Nocardia goodfellowii]|uniref:DUF3137 domain-containing protein n=1 Tax=Nocardia goodfellowii TaxID=882446 RepID=A0ABS4QD79_9NOCA|nr:DUF6585 family protein [Nocardia goodfellowii]MBP2188666.1 hypothetical protein [Nocardia goodfellowii]
MATPNTLEQETGETDDGRTVPLSQLIHLMAEYQKLGTHRQTYLPAPVSDTFVRACGIVVGCCVVLGVICVAVGAPAGGAAAGLLALVPAVPAAWRARSNRRHRAARLDLFDFGMTVYRSGEQIAGFRWETAQVKQRVIPFQNSAVTEYAFEMTGPGAHATFDDTLFCNGREWGKTIQSAITATQLPSAVTAIDNGEDVQFGDIALNLDTLVFRGQSYPWERIQLIDARSGLVRIKVDGRWISLAAVAAIPNFYIFNELAERLRVTDPI